jgi:hypothetical protein
MFMKRIQKWHKKIDVIKEGVMEHINYLEKELPAVKSIVTALDGEVNIEMVEVNTKLETLDEEVKTFRDKLKKRIENLVSPNQKLVSPEEIQVKSKAYIDGVDTG